jgi:hypothetical protein
MATDTEIAWAAGLFEGEGCFSIATFRSKYQYPRATIFSTDLDILERFAKIVKVGHLNSKPEKRQRKDGWKRKPQYRWTASSVKDVEVIVDLFDPWLGPRRLQQVRDSFAHVGLIEEKS